MSRLKPDLRRVYQVGIIMAIAIVYVGICVALFSRALGGQPLIGA